MYSGPKLARVPLTKARSQPVLVLSCTAKLKSNLAVILLYICHLLPKHCTILGPIQYLSLCWGETRWAYHSLITVHIILIRFCTILTLFMSISLSELFCHRVVTKIQCSKLSLGQFGMCVWSTFFSFIFPHFSNLIFIMLLHTSPSNWSQ